MQNKGMGLRPFIKIISEGNTIILHFAFCILHSDASPLNTNLSCFRSNGSKKQNPRVLPAGFANKKRGEENEKGIESITHIVKDKCEEKKWINIKILLSR